MAKLTAVFTTSAFALEGCPRWNRVEVAFAGRSNVGKSSLLNALTGIKGLARTSGTPGRTQSLNFFVADATLALVDLPGFGYAKVPQKIAREIAAMMSAYLSKRDNLTALVMLVDSRRGPAADEAALAKLVLARGVKVIVVATKCDKLKRSERAAATTRFLPLDSAPILCSVTSGEGIDELRRRITGLGAQARRVNSSATPFR